MGEHRDTEEHNRILQRRRDDEQGDGQEGCAEAEGNFAGNVQAEAASKQETAEPATENAANPADAIGDPGEVANAFDIQLPHITEVLREPENEKVPRRIGEEFREHENPDL